MTRRPRHRASAVRRARNGILPTAGAALAVIVASSLGSAGTFALWSDFALFQPAAIHAGEPDLSATGFEGLDHEYAVDALQTQTTVTVHNTGDVGLHSFAATRTLVDGSAALKSAVETTFTPVWGGASTDWDGWLDGLTLAPNAQRSYIVTTALDAGEVRALEEEFAVTGVIIEAKAGTSWLVAAGGGFSQAVDEAPPVSDFDFNSSFIDHGSGHSIEVVWEVPNGVGQNATFIISANGIEIGRGNFYWWPHFTISSGLIPTSIWPAQGQTAPITIEVAVAGSPDVIARGTLWITRIGSSAITMSITNPQPFSASSSSAPAPMVVLGTPAPSALHGAPLQPAPPTQKPVSPAAAPPAPAPAPAPAESTPPPVEAALEETQAAEPTEPAEPAAPAHPGDPGEAVTGPVVEVQKTEKDEQTLVLEWNGSDAPDGTVFYLDLGGTRREHVIAGREFTLTAEWIPDELKPGNGGATAVELTIVDADGVTVATGTFWVTAAEDGALTLHAEEPEA